MPTVPPECRSVLDVGCGAGQTLIALDLADTVHAYGVDVDCGALQLGRTLTQQVSFACAAGESLPFRVESFDFVVVRVALPYMQIPTALAEIRRVLRPRGRLWLVLHPVSMIVRELLSHLRAFNLKAVARRLYVLSNGLAFHCLGRLIRLPLNPPLCESFQTASGIRRALRGFDEVQITRAPFFVVTARKAE
jgi:ubiquinone/menaquinone biosynthesis C-methylase UbiE